jgi:hypothetical protein
VLLGKGAAAYVLGLGLAFGIASGASLPLSAQDSKPGKPAKPAPAPAQKPAAGGQAPAQTGAVATGRQAAPVSDAVRLNLLIRSTLIAVNQANQSGNYSVLRDLGAPAFQRFNTAASLAEKFAPIRKARVDLAPVFFFQPNLIQQPTLQDGKFLRLVGYIPTEPNKIDFDLAFQNIEGQWMLLGVNVGISQAKPKVSSAPSGGASADKKPAAKAEARQGTSATASGR